MVEIDLTGLNLHMHLIGKTPVPPISSYISPLWSTISGSDPQPLSSARICFPTSCWGFNPMDLRVITKNIQNKEIETYKTLSG